MNDRELTQKEINEIENTYLIGYIKDKYSIEPAGENSNDIRFKVELLCNDLQPFSNNYDTYIGFDKANRANKPFRDPEYKYLQNIDKKLDFTENNLYEKIIIFKPKIVKDRNNVQYRNVEIIDVINNTTNKKIEELHFIPVPYYQSEIKRFEDKLINKEDLTLSDYSYYYLPKGDSFPNYIMTSDYIYTINNVKTSTIDFRTFRVDSDSENICKFNYKEIPLTISYQVTQNLYYVDKDYLFNLNQIKIASDKWSMLITDEINYEETNSIKAKENNMVINTEYDFVKNFTLKTAKSGLYYNTEDLINFHTCVKSNLLTIIAGMSGTGKTRLAIEYASMFDVSESEKTLLFLPISPSYTEPIDMLGYLNNLNGLYTPADNGFIDFLINAAKNPDKLYIAVFDEMNLSQIEYWFAPILSIMEIVKIEDRNLFLYSSKANCINNERYPSKINIGKNIRFIGTVNLDETTKNFSDRLLDRTNLISLSKRSFLEMLEDKKNDDIGNKQPKSYGFNDYQSWITDSENLLNNLNIDNEEDKSLLQLLDDIHQQITKCDTDKGVSYRLLVAIYNFINNIPEDINGNYMIDRKKAIDMQINQRLITKLRGSEKQYSELLGYINGSDSQDGTLKQTLLSQKGQTVSDFEITIESLNKKAKELGNYGYAD